LIPPRSKDVSLEAGKKAFTLYVAGWAENLSFHGTHFDNEIREGAYSRREIPTRHSSCHPCNEAEFERGCWFGLENLRVLQGNIMVFPNLIVRDF
jgi:hypothetical protein